jgi:hypothetical protein
MADALCLEHPEVNFFPDRGQSSAPAKSLCGRCLCLRECREYALADPDLMGVWGGTSQRDRSRLRAEQGAVTAA